MHRMDRIKISYVILKYYFINNTYVVIYKIFSITLLGNGREKRRQNMDRILEHVYIKRDLWSSKTYPLNPAMHK